MAMKDARAVKLKELQLAISAALQEIKELKEKMATPALSEEERKKLQTDFRELMAVVNGLAEERKVTKMNKNNSRYFEWHPTGLNRRQRRTLRRLK